MSDRSNPVISLDYNRLPSAPHVLIRLIDLCHKTDVSFEELEAVIAKDAALCTKVVTISNSAAFGQWNDLRELKRILVVLGTKTIKSIALTSAVHQFFSQFSQQLGRTLGSLWLDALICAHLTRQLATLTDYEYLDEAHLAGLMHQLGQLVLLSREPAEYQQIMDSVSDQSGLLFKEHQRYGVNSAELGGEIIDHWGVGTMLGDAIRYQYKPPELVQDAQPLIKLLNLSSQLCNRLNHSHKKYLVEDHFFGLNQSIIDDLIEQSTIAAIADAAKFGIQVDEDHSIPQANIDDESIRLVLARKVREIALLEGIQQQSDHIDDLSDLVMLMSKNLQLLFGLSSSMFFFPDRDETLLTGIPSHSKNLSSGSPFTIKIKTGRSLISEAALSRALVNSRYQDQFKEFSVIDHQIMAYLASSVLLCIPLIYQDRFMGVIAAGCNPQQATHFHTENEMLTHFSTIMAESFAHQQQINLDLQKQLEQDQLEIDMQTRKVIHEINNPLTIINNYLEVISLDEGMDSSNKQHLDTVKEEIHRVSEILLQLRDYHLQETNHHSRINVNELITKLTGLFKPTFYKLNDIKNNLVLDQDLPEISTDQNRLKQIITNLVKNAVEALTEKGIVTIRTRSLVIINKQQYIEISIADNGAGIPDTILDKLFSPVESTKGDNHAGLGLTIVNKLVAELNGLISYSTSDSGGAEFIIHLPRD
jgi:signal transduction histidine kinase/HD-like signal output (HDOD) protein